MYHNTQKKVGLSDIIRHHIFVTLMIAPNYELFKSLSNQSKAQPLICTLQWAHWRFAKSPLVYNVRSANRRLTSLVKKDRQKGKWYGKR